MIPTIFKYEWIAIKRGYLLKIGFSVYCLLAFYAVFKGNNMIHNRESILYNIDTAQVARYKTLLVKYDKIDTLTKPGKSTFRLVSNAMRIDQELKNTVSMPTHPYAALSIGQLDNQSFYHQVSLWNNVYNTTAEEIFNPQKLMVGNLDLAYLLIFLLPLLVIGWNYNIQSDEKESGTLLLLKTYARKPIHFTGIKLAFRFGVLFTLVAVLNLIFFTALSNPFNYPTEIAFWLLTTFVYLLFWFALIFLVVSLNQSGKSNAIFLAGCWITILYIIPTALNRHVESSSSSIEKTAFEEARDNDMKVWEIPSSILIDSLKKTKFNADFNKYPITDTPSFKYAAFVEFGQQFNDHIGIANDNIKLSNYKKMLSFNIINPVFSTLSSLNELTRSDLNAYIHYTDAVKQYQQLRRYYIYQFMLGKKPFWVNEFKHFPKFEYQLKYIDRTLVIKNLIHLLTAIITFTTMGLRVGNRQLNSR
ncbi:DUF3526 domain-containing protein [Pedobacter lithocola]|uniref:DUF3526 domain-containing protein n=1 Tax=Pedobacter lithocola TaxID=1908239 RepID=A0ABV8PGU2_9SPHI